MTEKEELEFLRLWIKHGIENSHIKQGKINAELKAEGHDHYIAYDVDGNVFTERWPEMKGRI